MSRGSQGFASTYFTSGLQTPLWERVLEYHTKEDPMYYRSGSLTKPSLTAAMAELVLGYDAVLMFATAMDNLIQANLTITGKALSEALRTVGIIAADIRQLTHCRLHELPLTIYWKILIWILMYIRIGDIDIPREK